MRAALLSFALLTTLVACTGAPVESDAEAGTEAAVADTSTDTTTTLDAAPFGCGSMTCGATQVCVHPCNGGADSGTSGPEPVCMDAVATCRMHQCTCADGYCGSQPYACGYATDRDVRCMCA